MTLYNVRHATDNALASALDMVFRQVLRRPLSGYNVAVGMSVGAKVPDPIAPIEFPLWIPRVTLYAQAFPSLLGEGVRGGSVT